MKFSKTLLAAGVLSLTAGSVSALETEFGGQVNRAIMYAEGGYNANDLGEGSDTEFYHVDNRNSPTRFFMGGTQRLYDGWTVGAEIEVGVFANASNDVDPDEKNTGPEIDERITDAFIDTPYGKVTLGLGEGAAYNVGRRDYSGTGVISFRNPNLIGGSLRYELKSSSFKRKFDSSGNFTGTEEFDLANPSQVESSISGSIRDYNFEGRHNRIRYDSPRIGPVTVSVSAGHDGNDGQDSVMQLGVKSGLRVPGGRVLVGVGYSRATQNVDNVSSDDPDVNIYGGSVSYFHSDTGLNLTLAAVNRAEELSEADKADNFDVSDSDLGQFRYAKLGYRPNRQHAFDIHYGETRDRNKQDEKGTVVGIGYVWSPTQMFDAYAGAKIHSFERAEFCTGSGRTCYNPEYEDIKIVTTGLRVKF